jgi:CspA family cold shock protein
VQHYKLSFFLKGECDGAPGPGRATTLHDWKEHGNMPSGTVKWFNTTKGYGFIAPEEGGKDVFVHISAVERSGLTGLADNQKVSYDLKEGRDGRMMASDLKTL